MKIAFYITTILEQGGGSQEYLITTAKKLSELYGHNVDIVGLDDKYTVTYLRFFLCIFYLKYVRKSHFYNESLTSIRARLGKVKYVKCKSFKELRDTLSKYDVVYSKNELLEALLFSGVIGFENIGPVIFACVTSINFTGSTSPQAIIRNKLYNGSVYKFLCRNVKAFHVLNSHDEHFLQKLFPSKRIYRICPSFNFDEFKRLSNEYPANFEFDGSAINIISVGRLSIQKGTEELIKLIDEINEQQLNNKVVWYIVGKGEEAAKVEALVARWKNVKYLGYIENKFLPSILENMSLYISLSKGETFGYTIVEANTFEVPVISYDLSGPRELVEQGKNGYLAKDYEDFKRALIDFLEGDLHFTDVEKVVRDRLDARIIYGKILKMFEEVYNK